MVKSAPTDLDVADRVKKGEKRRLVMEIQPRTVVRPHSAAHGANPLDLVT